MFELLLFESFAWMNVSKRTSPRIIIKLSMGMYFFILVKRLGRAERSPYNLLHQLWSAQWLFIYRANRRKRKRKNIVTSSSASIVPISIANASQTNIANKFLICYLFIVILTVTVTFIQNQGEIFQHNSLRMFARALIIFVTFRCLPKKFLHRTTERVQRFCF